MAKQKQPKTIATSPLGVLAHAWIAKPDNGFNDEDVDNPKYKAKVLIAKEGDHLEGPVVRSKVDGKWVDIPLTELAMNHATEYFGKPHSKLVIPVVKDGDEMYENAKDDKKDKYEAFRGHWVIDTKSKFQPSQYDAAKEELAEGEFASSGDLGRVSFSLYAYGEGAKSGVTGQLRTVQVIEKRALSGAGGADDFDDDMEEYEGGYRSGAPVDDDDDDGEY